MEVKILEEKKANTYQKVIGGFHHNSIEITRIPRNKQNEANKRMNSPTFVWGTAAGEGVTVQCVFERYFRIRKKKTKDRWKSSDATRPKMDMCWIIKVAWFPQRRQKERILQRRKQKSCEVYIEIPWWTQRGSVTGIAVNDMISTNTK